MGQLIGFMTSTAPDALSRAGVPGERVAVYLPMSYQIGGYTLYVERERIIPLDMDVEEAMRMVLTAGIAGD